MALEIITKKCLNCWYEFSIHDDRMNYYKDCCLDEFEPFEVFGGDFHEKQAYHQGAVRGSRNEDLLTVREKPAKINTQER